MSLDSNSGEIITLQEAKELITNFRSQYPNNTVASFIGSNNVREILIQEDCIGIRIYNGYDNVTGQMKLVLVGVDSAEKDMTAGIIMDKLITCPPYCDYTSDLLL